MAKGTKNARGECITTFKAAVACHRHHCRESLCSSSASEHLGYVRTAGQMFVLCPEGIFYSSIAINQQHAPDICAGGFQFDDDGECKGSTWELLGRQYPT